MLLLVKQECHEGLNRLCSSSSPPSVLWEGHPQLACSEGRPPGWWQPMEAHRGKPIQLRYWSGQIHKGTLWKPLLHCSGWIPRRPFGESGHRGRFEEISREGVKMVVVRLLNREFRWSSVNYSLRWLCSSLFSPVNYCLAYECVLLPSVVCFPWTCSFLVMAHLLALFVCSRACQAVPI